MEAGNFATEFLPLELSFLYVSHKKLQGESKK